MTVDNSSSQDHNADPKDERIATLEKALHLGDNMLATVFKLPPQQANLLGMLLSQPVVTTDTIKSLGVANTPKVAINRLRKRMEAYQITIRRSARSGYWLDENDKAVINSAVEMMAKAYPAPEVQN